MFILGGLPNYVFCMQQDQREVVREKIQKRRLRKGLPRKTAYYGKSSGEKHEILKEDLSKSCPIFSQPLPEEPTMQGSRLSASSDFTSADSANLQEKIDKKQIYKLLRLRKKVGGFFEPQPWMEQKNEGFTTSNQESKAEVVAPEVQQCEQEEQQETQQKHHKICRNES